LVENLRIKTFYLKIPEKGGRFNLIASDTYKKSYYRPQITGDLFIVI